MGPRPHRLSSIWNVLKSCGSITQSEIQVSDKSLSKGEGGAGRRVSEEISLPLTRPFKSPSRLHPCQNFRPSGRTAMVCSK
jgi:hypothetical protein